MSKEVHLQIGMFTQELVDTRTKKQKKQANIKQQPAQAAMFSQRELAQFGVQARPQLPLAPKTSLKLIAQDPRTEKEKRVAMQREIERRTYPMWGNGK